MAIGTFPKRSPVLIWASRIFSCLVTTVALRTCNVAKQLCWPMLQAVGLARNRHPGRRLRWHSKQRRRLCDLATQANRRLHGPQLPARWKYWAILRQPEKLVQRVLQVRRTGLHQRNLAWALAQLAYVRSELGRTDQVRELLDEAQQLFYDMGEKKAVCHVLQMRARIERAANRSELARPLLAASVKNGLELHDVIVISKGLLEAAALALDETDVLHAAELLVIADSILPVDNVSLQEDLARMISRVDSASPAVLLIRGASCRTAGRTCRRR